MINENAIKAHNENKNDDTKLIPKCGMCLQNINIPKNSKKKFQEKKEAVEARAEQGGRKGGNNKIKLKHDENSGMAEGLGLKLCGCHFCKECLELYVNEQLDHQNSEFPTNPY